MPELPEVETIKLGLQKYLVGHRIEKVDVRLPKLVHGDVKNIEGGKVITVRRFGKGLVIDLDNKNSVAIHIKLTGQLIYRGPNLKTKVKLSKKVGESIPNKWTHVIFKLKTQNSNHKSVSKNSKLKNGGEENAYLYYNDLRQFGWIKIVKTDEVMNLPFFRDLGLEPFGKLTFTVFKKIILSSNTPIKTLIMDQKKIGGIGNIYANDGLFEAGIDPRRRAGTLTNEEIEKLYKSLLKVLKAGFKYKGASELNFVNVLGEEGEYQKHSLVYGKKGKKCSRCGGTIQKVYFAGRGTYFCPTCQK